MISLLQSLRVKCTHISITACFKPHSYHNPPCLVKSAIYKAPTQVFVTFHSPYTECTSWSLITTVYIIQSLSGLFLIKCTHDITRASYFVQLMLKRLSDKTATEKLFNRLNETEILTDVGQNNNSKRNFRK